MKISPKRILSDVIRALKKMWGVETGDLIGILAAFSCTGTSLLFIREPLFQLTGLAMQPLWLKVVAYPFLMIPAFYLLLLFYGTLTGQQAFVINRLRRLLRVSKKL